MHPANFAIFGYGRPDPTKFANDVKGMKEMAKVIDHYLKGKHWISGESFSLGDIFVGCYMLSAFQLVFDAGFRKAMPNLTSWFERFCQEPTIIKRFGHIKSCKKAMKAGAAGPPGNAKPTPKKEEAKPVAAVDDDLDLFGDDNEEDAAAAKAVGEKAKAAKDKKKKVVIAQSLVLFEVKPLDDTTNLDDLAKRILGIKMDGLYWKTEYKKEPVAFGIFKLIIGVTVEDDKVSVDAL